MEVLIALLCHWSTCANWKVTAGVWILGTAHRHRRQDPFSFFWRRQGRGTKSNSLLCGARPIAGATEKGQPGSHVVRAVCEPSLSCGMKLQLWSDVNTAPLVLCKAECTTSTAAPKCWCCLSPPLGDSLENNPWGVAVLTWSENSSSRLHWVNPKHPRPKGTSQSAFRREDPAVLTTFSQGVLGISPKKHWQLHLDLSKCRSYVPFQGFL